MGLLDRRRKRKMSPGQVLVASGVRLTRQNADAVRQFITGRQEWQAHAWAYRDLIGELREGLQYQCRAVGRVAFMPAQINPNADEPWLLDADECTLPEALRQAAVEELNRLPIDSMAWKTRLAENLAVPGEAWLHGRPDPRDPDGEVWDVRSVDEVEPSLDGGFSIHNGGNRPDEVNLDDEDLLRLWQPHPARYWQADSPLRALLDTCEDVVLIGKELRAASRSRIAANGLLLFPTGMLLQSNRRGAEAIEVDSSKFASALAEQITAPIANEGEPGAVVPVVITGEVEDLAAVRHVEIGRDDSDKLISKLDKALARLGAGMDIPAEIITGMADANHWTAWQISTETFRHHIQPLVRVVGDALAEGYLREALLSRRTDGGQPEFDPADVAQVCVWHDAGALTENPNRGDDAVRAFEHGAIGFEALRNALGFAPGDEPDDDEFVRMIAWKAGVSPDLAATVLRVQYGARLIPEGQGDTGGRQVIDAGPAQRIPAIGPGQTGGQPTGGDGVDPDDPVPDVPDDVQAAARARAADVAASLVHSLIAAGQQGRRFEVHEDLHRELLDLERVTRQRLAAECDAALRRAVERAQGRTTSRTNGAARAQYRAQIEAAPDRYPTAVLGRDVVTAALGLDEQTLLADAWEALYPRFARILGRSIVQAARITARLLGLTGNRAQQVEQRVIDDMTSRVDMAWQGVVSTLNVAAERELFDPLDLDAEPAEADGEGRDAVITEADLREALAEIGGALDEIHAADEAPYGGMTSGSTISRELDEHGGQRLGFEFHYGITPRVRTFEPHWDRHMERFPSFTDPRLDTRLHYGGRYVWVGPYFRPGDHRNCSCDYMPLWAIPEHAENVEARQARDEPQMRADRLLAEDDDRQPGGGYPTGPTTAQIDRDERDRVRALQREYITEYERT